MKKEVKKIGEKVKEAIENMEQKQNVEQQTAVNENEAKQEPEKNPEEIQEEINLKTLELQKCLAILERKKQLSSNRTSFICTLDNLNAAEESLNCEELFESKSYKLRFAEVSSYNSNDIFSISNTSILLEFVAFMRSRIMNKISEIESELIAE